MRTTLGIDVKPGEWAGPQRLLPMKISTRRAPPQEKGSRLGKERDAIRRARFEISAQRIILHISANSHPDSRGA